jgi:hypothetical protein
VIWTVTMQRKKIYKRHSLKFVKLICKLGWRNANQRNLSNWIYTKLAEYLWARWKFLLKVLLINFIRYCSFLRWIRVHLTPGSFFWSSVCQSGKKNI